MELTTWRSRVGQCLLLLCVAEEVRAQLPSSTMLVVSEENRYHRGCSQWNVYVSTECATRHSSTDCTGASDQFHCTGNYNSHTYVPSTTLAWRIDGANESTVTFYMIIARGALRPVIT